MINKKGFTLVEVIVVAVIVAVLAGVAIPMYIGYINDSKVSLCTNLAADLASAVSSGINSSATNITGTWPGDNKGPVTISWTMPPEWQGGTAPFFRIPNGITVTTTGTGLVAGTAAAPFTIVAKVTAKPALVGQTANY